MDFKSYMNEFALTQIPDLKTWLDVLRKTRLSEAPVFADWLDDHNYKGSLPEILRHEAHLPNFHVYVKFVRDNNPELPGQYEWLRPSNMWYACAHAGMWGGQVGRFRKGPCIMSRSTMSIICDGKNLAAPYPSDLHEFAVLLSGGR